MRLNSPEALALASEVFRNYGYSWTAARAAGYRDADGVLVIPRNPPSPVPSQTNGSADLQRKTG
jgi:hypothetical protein